MSFSLFSPKELAGLVGQRAAKVRLALGRRQADVAKSAGISLATLRRFEAGENVGFDVVVRIALTLGSERELSAIFPVRDERSFEQIVRENAGHTRKRAPSRKPK
jgi:transcriptional regulator with XRE-family HTH domain